MTVLHGSAAMSLKCGGICSDHFVSNFMLSLAVKEFWKSLNILWSYRHSSVSCFIDSHYSGGCLLPALVAAHLAK